MGQEKWESEMSKRSMAAGKEYLKPAKPRPLQSPRTNRIRAGAIIILISVVAMLVVAGFNLIRVVPSHVLKDAGVETFWEKMSFAKYTGAGLLPFDWVFAFGMVGVGVGAILLIVGLTTQAGKP